MQTDAGKKKIPERRCLGCNETKPKSELIRIVREPDGNMTLDATGKKSGRGAYICKNPSCLKKCRKNGRVAKSLKVAVPDEIYDRLEEEINLLN